MVRFGYCSCRNYWLVFRGFQAFRKLGEVLTKLGVLRLKDLDVGIARTEGSKFGRNYRGIFRRFSDELEVETGIILFIFARSLIWFKFHEEWLRNGRDIRSCRFSQFPATATVAGVLR